MKGSKGGRKGKKDGTKTKEDESSPDEGPGTVSKNIKIEKLLSIQERIQTLEK